MVDIQSATAEIRREKKKHRKIEETTKQKYNAHPLLHRAAIRRKKKEETHDENIMSASASQGGHNQVTNFRRYGV